MRRAVTISLLAVSVAALTACGNVAGANTPPPPPTLPPAPPLSQEAQDALNQPTPTPPPPAPAPAVSRDATVLASDDFSRGTLDNWTAVDFSEGPDGPSTWTAKEGAVFQAGDALGLPAPDSTYLVTGDAAWRDYTVVASAYASNPTRVGLVARKDGSNYYQLYLDAQPEASALVLTVVKNGETTELARTPVAAATQGSWLELKLAVRGATITGSVGTTTVTAQDTSFSAGQAGLYATADGVARFDNVVITE